MLTGSSIPVVQSPDVATVYLDFDLRVRKFTAGFAETFQISTDDLGRRIETLPHRLLRETVFQDIERAFESESIIESEVRDRQGKWFLMRIVPFPKEMGSGGGAVSLIDITRLKSAEHRLRLMSKVFQEGANPIIVEDLDGRIVDVNEAALHAFGWQRDELLGQDSSVLVPDELRKPTIALRQRCRVSEHVRDVETIRCHKSGATLPISLTMSLLTDETSAPVALASIMPDITRRKQAEAEREQYAVKLEGINQRLRKQIKKRKAAEGKAHAEALRLEAFLAMLSHEMRNPLGALLNASYLLDRQLDESDGGSPHKVIQRQARQLARLLDDLLDVSRVTHGKLAIRREIVDLTALRHDTVQAVRALVEARQHELEIDLPDHPLYVEGDPARLRQIIENLLTNAIKYTPQGGRICLALRRSGESAELTVRDNGIGIATENVERLFEMFVQVDATSDGSGGGMGIGLTLVRHLVQLQGGTVTAHSDGPGQGSAFTVRLPLTKKKPRPSDTPPPPPMSGQTIVLVEDNQDAREMLRSLLELDGFHVVTANDGEQGVEAIVRETPQVAFVDIGLPKCDGLEVARRVRAAIGGRNVYLVALTGFGQNKDRSAVMEAGFDEHLVKPVHPDQITNVLNRPRKPR